MILILENLRSLNNIGSLFRTADGFGVKEIILVGSCGYPPEQKISKTALGAEQNISWTYFLTMKEAESYIHKLGYKTVALEIDDNAIEVNSLPTSLDLSKIAIILGSESEGVSKETLDSVTQIIKIPMQGEKTSFNVAIAGAIVMYEFWRNLKDKNA